MEGMGYGWFFWLNYRPSLKRATSRAFHEANTDQVRAILGSSLLKNLLSS